MTPLSWTNLEDGIWQWVRDALNGPPVVPENPEDPIPPDTFPVIWDTQNNPRPATAYVALSFGAIQKFGTTASSALVTPGTDTEVDGEPVLVPGTRPTRVDAKIVLNLQAFGGNPQSMLWSIRNSLDLESVQAYLDTIGVSPLDSNDITDLSGISDSRPEARASWDIPLLVCYTVTETISWIENTVPEATILPPV